MRPIVFIVSLVAIGVLAGVGASYGDLRRLGYSDVRLLSPKLPEQLQDDPHYNPQLPHPRAIAAELVFDFGAMERGEKLSHTFKVENQGDTPLVLEKGSTSCKCTVSGLDKTQVAPGESAEVTMEWTAESELPEFRQTATIKTNDPGRSELKFEVKGRIVQAILVEPRELNFEKSAGVTKSYEVHLTSVNFDNLEIVGHSFEDPATASYFDVNARPLTADELKQMPFFAAEPKGGALVTVTVKPGLPLGPIRQKIRLATNIESRPEIELPVHGSIQGDISLVGRGWNQSELLLTLGLLRSGAGAERELKIHVRGPHAGQVKFQVQEVRPAQIKVSLGESSELNDGRVQQVPLSIEIPADLPPVSLLGKNHGGFGEVVLSTTHPDFPELRLQLKFAIERQ